MFKVEVVEVAGMVEVVKATVMKKIIRRRDYRAKQIGVEEDAIKDAVKDIISTSCYKCQKYGHYANNCNSMLQLWQNGSLCKRLSSRGKGGRNDQPNFG